MDGMTAYVEKNEQINSTDTNTSNFGAKVFKISRDPAGSRLTYLKVTSGTLKVKDTLTGIAGKQQSKKESDFAQDRSETVMNNWKKRSIRSAFIPVKNMRWYRKRKAAWYVQ